MSTIIFDAVGLPPSYEYNRGSAGRTVRQLNSLFACITLILFACNIIIPTAALPVFQPSPKLQIPLLQSTTDRFFKWHSGTMDSEQSPIKVMIVGNSMTQGHEGDWTWRYRLWEWFKNQKIPVKFVGPYIGTFAPADVEPPTSGGYAVGVSPDFDSHHFSNWGRQLAQDAVLIRGIVRTYQPDYLLVMLGFNDIGWGVSNGEGTLKSMELFVKEARAGKPDVNFALANIVQRLYLRDDLPIETAKYNRLLAEAIPRWNTSTSRIELVRLQENYDCGVDSCPAAYDGLHPNALGEFQVAQAFSRTLLNDYKIGKSELIVPDLKDIPKRPISVPTGLKAESCPVGIVVTWDPVYGAFGYDVQARPKGREEWEFYAIPVNTHTTWAPEGQEWEYRVRTDNLNGGEHSEWSGILSVVAHPRAEEDK